MRVLTGVGGIISAAHRRNDGLLHGHTWEVVAWWEGSPDAVQKQEKLTAYLRTLDHCILPDELALGEQLAERIKNRMGCFRVDVNRPLERIYARVEGV